MASNRACLCLQRQPREVSAVPPLGSGVKMGQDQEERQELRSPHLDPHPHPPAPSPSHVALPLAPSQVQEVAAPSQDCPGKAGKGESDAEASDRLFIPSDAVMEALLFFFRVCVRACVCEAVFVPTKHDVACLHIWTLKVKGMLA